MTTVVLMMSVGVCIFLVFNIFRQDQQLEELYAQIDHGFKSWERDKAIIEELRQQRDELRDQLAACINLEKNKSF